MGMISTDALYQLLPAIYRVRDAEQGNPIRALLEVMAAQAALVEEDINQLYDNLFIETCEDWVIPYIGELVGVRGLDPGRGSASRAQVANTLHYRRRKGTAALLELLARDTTAWPALAVEYFQRLGITQYLGHLRPDQGGTLDLRTQTKALEQLGSPFDSLPRKVDVRSIARGGGRHNIPSIGLFLWRLASYPITQASARALGNGRFSFNPLGIDAPLFNLPQAGPDTSQRPAESNLPAPLRRQALLEDLETFRTATQPSKQCLYFGGKPVFQVAIQGQPGPIQPGEIAITDLKDWQPEATADFQRMAVDPHLGRILLLGEQANPALTVNYGYGFSGALGGGAYSRQDTVSKEKVRAADWKIAVKSKADLLAVPQAVSSLAEAVKQWNQQTNVNFGIIAISDNLTYEETDLEIKLRPGSELLIIAADWIDADSLSAIALRPHLRLTGKDGKLTVTGLGSADSDAAKRGKFSLNGLLLEGWLEVGGNLGGLQLEHCTLVPGHRVDGQGLPLAPGEPSILVNADCLNLQLTIARSITGPLHLPKAMAGLNLSDSIVDAPTLLPYPALVSAKLSSRTLSSANPAVQLHMEGESPIVVFLPKTSLSLISGSRLSLTSKALTRLATTFQAAIRSAAPSSVYAKTRVIVLSGRLLIIPGIPKSLTVRSVGTDRTASSLGLVASEASDFRVYLTPPLSPSLSFANAGRTPSLPGGDIKEAKAIALDGANNQWLVITNPSLLEAPGKINPPIHFGIPPWPAIAADASGTLPGPAAVIEQSTVFGAVHVQTLQRASETIFTQAVQADRLQTGCVRFCYLPEESLTPKRFRCQPETTLAELKLEDQKQRLRTALLPSFTSRHYGQPGYAQLRKDGHPAIATGGENGTELGAFHFLQNPHREAALRAALEEYLRANLEAGIIFAT